MYDIEMQEPSEDFVKCWQAAGRHIQRMSHGLLHNWLKSSLNPPFLEHLSFRLANQLFFVRIEDLGSAIMIPGSRNGLVAIAEGCRGYPCIMPMHLRDKTWVPVIEGWGLVDLRTGKKINPEKFISDKKITMTDWELHDFAVQVVKDWILKENRKIMSWQGCPEVDPSIWFVGDEGPEWVVVRAVRYPAKRASLPKNWHSIVGRCAVLGRKGHFASVSVACANESFDSSRSEAEPLWRGHAMFVNFQGLEPIATLPM